MNFKFAKLFLLFVLVILFDNCQADKKSLANRLDKVLSVYSNIRSVMVYKNNEIVYERYFRGTDKNSMHEIASITKSVTSCLIGIAIKEGFIKSIDEKITGYFPDYKKFNKNKMFEDLTIRNLLSMNSGLDWQGARYFDWYNGSNQVEYVLKLDFKYKPGEKFNYSDGACHLLSVILKKATGMEVRDFADKYLFSKLKITDYEWKKDAQGNYFASTDIRLKASDMLKFGVLYLNNGNYEGSQVILGEYCNDSTEKKIKADFPMNADYCYLWWISNKFNYKAFFALGYGGQFIYVVPSKKTVVVLTSEQDDAHFNNLNIIEDYILKYAD